MNAFWILGAELLKVMMDYEVINRSVLIGMSIYVLSGFVNDASDNVTLAPFFIQ